MLHPWHAKIHASSVSDWSLQGPLSARLACGLELSFSVQEQTLIVFGSIDGVGEHLLDMRPKTLPQDFADGLSLLKKTLDVETAMPLYHRFQAFLVSQDLHGQWSVLILPHALIISPFSTGQILGYDVSEDLLPAALRGDLLARWNQYFPSFESTPAAQVGEFYCTVPSSSHARLQILQHHTP